ncbi:hypothetical protein EK21DRAFT_85534 [Setomelanomma holmii]|uniref:Uncharacterized protein n=1 Tax=Setomelanomma holmii TaxID=210430 RepID=A0A9P4LQR2_9PLEO|nr:hypothetical protein EK21DRAFT_85534 [Setomelanomma holmii]
MARSHCDLSKASVSVTSCTGQDCGNMQGQKISSLIVCSTARYTLILGPNLRRRLTFDGDILDAFSGIIHALSPIFGGFHWGLLQNLFARAMFLKTPYAIECRTLFPSWSWLGRKIASEPSSATNIASDIPLVGGTLTSMVHIYAYDKLEQPKLLPGLRDNVEGVEGFSSPFIDAFNKSTKLDPLPLHPSIDDKKCVSVAAAHDPQVLLFWTQVVCVPRQWSALSRYMSFDYARQQEQVEILLIVGCFDGPGSGE